ncbi:MAG: hypothetical protein GY760_29485, partial [Deltaproteobacteria bacterium]|nr:hypothetical protein [Deltaproteobacteria bacterium]
MLFQIYIVMKDQIKNDYLKRFYIRIYTGSFKRKDVREWILFKFETPIIFNFLEDFKSFREKKSKTFSLSFSHLSTTNNVYIKENSHNYPGDTPIYRFIMTLPRRLPITHPTTPDSSNANTQASTSYEHEQTAPDPPDTDFGTNVDVVLEVEATNNQQRMVNE